MEKHVPTLETCKKLKAAGFDQHSHFFWHVIGKTPVLSGTNLDFDIHHSYFDGEYAAPLLTEILEHLPTMDDSNDHLQITKGKNLYGAGYSVDQEHIDPVEAAALLWLELHKEVND